MEKGGVTGGISLCNVLTTIYLYLSCIRDLIPLSFVTINMGLKLTGSITLLLVLGGSMGNTFTIGVVHVLLSILLFSSPLSLLFSLATNVVSAAIVCLFSGLGTFNVVNFDVVKTLARGLIRATITLVVFKGNILFCLPVLVLSTMVDNDLVNFLIGVLGGGVGPLF